MSYRVLVTACRGPAGASFLALIRDVPGVEGVGVDAAGGSVPFGADPEFSGVIRRTDADLVVPGCDEDALALLRAGDPRCACRVPAWLWLADRARLYGSLEEMVRVPRHLVGAFVKRRRSRGGAGAYALGDDMLACERLRGPEWSVDLIRLGPVWGAAFPWGVPVAVVRRRLDVVRGVATAGEVVDDSLRAGLAARVAARLGYEGPLNVQFIDDEGGHPVLTDVNPRFGGGVSIAAAAGVNLPRLLVERARGRPDEIAWPRARPGHYRSFVERRP